MTYRKGDLLLIQCDGLDDDYCILSFIKLYATFSEEEDSL